MFSVLIPYRGDCQHRTRALDWVVGRWHSVAPEAEVVVCGDAEAGPWRKALAVRECIARSNGSVFVISDADVWCDTAVDAVDRVSAGVRWVVPHRAVRRLSEQTTAAVLAGADPSIAARKAGLYAFARPAYEGVAGGGIVVLSRETYGECPLDLRFSGWGGEDEAWGCALQALFGPPMRLQGLLWHLWHPLAKRLSSVIGSPENDLLRRAYFKAQKDPEQMRRVLESAGSRALEVK